MKSINATKRGFTLIELLVVVSIISLLSSVVLVTVDTARQKARLTAVKANLKTLFTEAELYRSDNASYIASGSTNTCSSMGGFIALAKSQEILSQISTLTGKSISSNDFYCSIQSDKWSLAVDVSALTNLNQVLCASTGRGRIDLLGSGNSNDVPASDFVSNGDCVTP